MRVAHFTFYLGSWNQCGHRVDDNHVNAAAANQYLGHVEGLLARVRLMNEQFVHIHAKSLRVPDIQGMLRIDERGHPAQFLRFRHDVLRQCRLAGRFVSIYFDLRAHAGHHRCPAPDQG